jgi:uridine phosphorylase
VLKKEYPILEFDLSKEAVIEPSKIIKPINIPKHGVLASLYDVIDKLVQDKKTKFLHNIETEAGLFSVYEIQAYDKPLAVVHPGLGAPLAATVLEEMIALGCKKFIACGGAGVLQKDILRGEVVIVNSAIRDEGTSYHYLPPAREVNASKKVMETIEKTLQKHSTKYVVGKTWTTDGIFRETKDRIVLRKSEGCLTVEMEGAAFLAVSQFRKVDFGQILCAGDDVSGEKWDKRYCDQRASHREKLFWLAAEACLSL